MNSLSIEKHTSRTGSQAIESAQAILEQFKDNAKKNYPELVDLAEGYHKAFKQIVDTEETKFSFNLKIKQSSLSVEVKSLFKEQGKLHDFEVKQALIRFQDRIEGLNKMVTDLKTKESQ